MPFPTTSVLDNFNRANEGPPPSASWVNSGGSGLSVVSNQCNGASSGDSSTWNASFAANQECFAVCVSTICSLLLRLVTSTNNGSNHYEIYFDSATVLQVWKVVSGSWTQLGSNITITRAPTDQWGIDANGTAIGVYKNGTSIDTRTDGDITGAGFLALWAGETNTRFDDFGGGAISAGPPPSPPSFRARTYRPAPYKPGRAR